MTKRNAGIDILRFLCAFLVVCIHVPFPGIVGSCLKAFARIAVTIFFICSGYFLAVKLGGRYKRLVHILRLIVLSNSFYFLLNFSWNAVKGESAEYLREVFTVQMLKDLLLFNQSLFCEPLWYLNALLYVIAIMILLDHVGYKTSNYT